MKKELKFFIPLKKIPNITHQQKKINFKNKTVYESAELKEVRAMFMSELWSRSPEELFKPPIQLSIKWCYPFDNKHKKVEWKTTKPDCDNLNKLFQDCMEKTGFFKNDSQISRLILEKFWNQVGGVYVEIEEL